MILFELSQKRTLEPFMLREDKVAALFTTLDYGLLAKQNYQDFIYMGNIMKNPLVIKEIDLK